MGEPAPEPGADSRCPRCGQSFHCGVADAQPCWCSRVTVSAETLADLRQSYDRCVCSTCLAEMAIRPA